MMDRRLNSRVVAWLNFDALVLVVLLAIIATAGGASQAAELGQVVVRTAAIAAMFALHLSRRTLDLHSVRLPAILIALIAGVAALQLVPLPPAVWTALPGRAMFEAAVAQQPQPWRPINLAPDAGLNTLLSLSVPLAVLLTVAGISRSNRHMVIGLMVAVTVVSALVGTLQLAGARFDSPFVNDSATYASGLFANRNHQALLLAVGLPLLTLWALQPAAELRPVRWAVGAGLLMWLLLLILATGSRAGLGLAAFGLLASALVASRSLRFLRADLPRWALPAMLVGIGLGVAAVLAVGLASDRAQSLMRLAAPDDVGDLRVSSLPLLWTMVASYFPVGSGFGSFDPAFRIVEPFGFLAPTYFNHAHNDAAELLIEGGLAGAAIIATGLFIWGRFGLISVRHFAAGQPTSFVGWNILTMILVASLVDYPARTPLIMAMAALAAWLVTADRDDPPLPS